LTLPEGDDDFSGRWRAIKKIFSNGLPNTVPMSVLNVMSEEFGNVVFGSMRSVTKKITSGMLIISITILLSMAG